MAAWFPVVVLCGARQVGKSTLLRHAFPDWPMQVFDPAIDVGNARADPDLFLDNHPSPVILDEIQFAPERVVRNGRAQLRQPRRLACGTGKCPFGNILPLGGRSRR